MAGSPDDPSLSGPSRPATIEPFNVDSGSSDARYQPLEDHTSTARWMKPRRSWWPPSSSSFLSSPSATVGVWIQRIRPVVQPRLTWRYILFSLVLAYIVYCVVTWQPFFAHRLPGPTGLYSVGAIDIEAPLEQPRLIHEAKFKGADAENAFVLESVLFTLYYPAQKSTKSKKPKHYWIPKPIAVTAEGYAKVAHISNFFTNTLFTGAIGLMVGGITIPAQVDVPLITQQELATAPIGSDSRNAKHTSGDQEGGLPVIVFTHGMASSRTDYTHWASELASRGYIVAAIEHRDGSCPGSVIMKRDKPPKTRLHFTSSDVSPDIENDDWKNAQLSFREAEIEETVRVLRSINAGNGRTIYHNNPRDEGSDLESWKDRLNTQAMVLAGHSYGATGTLRALKAGPKSNTLPFKAAIALDPGKGSGPLNSNISVPILVIHSNSWSSTHSVFYGRPHFEVVREIVSDNVERGNPSWFVTSLGTSHPSVTDAPLLEPLLLSWTTGAKIDVYEGLRQYVHVCEDFMVFLATGEKRYLLKEKAEYPEYDERHGWGKYKGQGEDEWRRFWQVHVAPQE